MRYNRANREIVIVGAGFKQFAPLNALVSKTVFGRFLYIAKARRITPRFCDCLFAKLYRIIAKTHATGNTVSKPVA